MSTGLILITIILSLFSIGCFSIILSMIFEKDPNTYYYNPVSKPLVTNIPEPLESTDNDEDYIIIDDDLLE